ncbi:MAG: hypothetical protein CBC55_09025 [Gammaproteobacteria bacterium TMED95]|nr:MAG: hypothetical protein CBC55_09025 [Gammaproteobacteria bacterium TMED95]|tara:strand:+ start:3387 stop:4007 length:621 start_codon:yes stop_codon:yes gene_type:complete
MAKAVHILGNGHSSKLYLNHKDLKGMKVVCNLPPFAVERVAFSCMVDFKMMKALTEGSLQNPYTWVLGYRPKVWMENNPGFHMKNAAKIKEFYTVLPEYTGGGGEGYTNFNCGHFATHYVANKIQPDRIHLWGFDSIMDFDIRSRTDFYLNSDRGGMNTERLSGTWRKVFNGIFKEFKDTQFIIHHTHNNIKIAKPENVEISVEKV